MEIPDEALAELGSQIPHLLTPGAAEALAVKVYRVAHVEKQSALEALRDCLEDYQNPVSAEVLEFQIQLAVREASDLDFVPMSLRGVHPMPRA